MFNTRLAFSGEIPLTHPGLNPVALQRIDPGTAAKTYKDAVTPTRLWTRASDGALDGNAAGPWGTRVGMNLVDPATEKGYFNLPHFDGLWPATGRLLIGLWVQQSYTMSFNPLMSTRADPNPLVYLSTNNAGRLRHQVYGPGGTLVLDQYEDAFGLITDDFQFIGMLLDITAGTSRMFAVNRATRQAWTGPTRTLTGAPNTTCTADLDVFRLGDGTYFTGGRWDEALIAHPSPVFDLDEFADALALAQYANGQDTTHAPNLTITDTTATALAATTLVTGAERVSWGARPTVQGAPAGSVAHWSTDDGSTWQSGTQLPEVLDGLLRWDIPLGAGQTFEGLTITVPTTPAPTLGAIADQELEQGGLVTVPLTFTVSGDPVWRVDAPDVVTATVSDDALTVAAGFEVGDAVVTVTLADGLGRTAQRTFTVSVAARSWEQGPPPRYPHAPIILWGDDEPERVLIDATAAVVTTEVNGAHTFEFSLPPTHPAASLIINERRVTVAGETYWIRRVTTGRQGRKLSLDVYAEARFYELSTAGQVDAAEFSQVTAGAVMEIALAGTGWHVGVANQTSRRTYQIEDTNPLALLRTIQQQHGGDLIFDNAARTVSLVTSSGRDQGVLFAYGRGLTEASRVVDTTSLVTRIYARNADGITIASVNGGKAYVEDTSYTSEIRSAVYDFKSGTSPYTMLSMATATLAKRSRPDYSYSATVADMSVRTGADIDRFDAGDLVTVVDQEIGLQETQRIVRLEYDILRPWSSSITLSATLRGLGSSDATDAGVLDTGAGNGTFDLVPFNLLMNGRFDNDMAHWASLGTEIVDGNGTGDHAVRFSGAGERWIEQTVTPDARDAYALSFNLESQGPAGWVPTIKAVAYVTYEDGSTEDITLDLT